MSTISVFLPRGWARIDLLGDREAQIRAVVRARLREAPLASRAQLTSYLQDQLDEATRALADDGALLLAFPVVPLDGRVVQPQLVIARWDLPPERDPMDVLLVIASSDVTAHVLQTGALVALRVRADADVTGQTQAALQDVVGGDAAGLTTGVQLRQLGLRYFFGDPGRRDRWLTAAFSMTYVDGDEAADLVESMTTLVDDLIAAIGWDA